MAKSSPSKAKSKKNKAGKKQAAASVATPASASQSLAGKVAWITGAGSGIGAGVARKLASLGATVVLTGRRADALEKVADSITAAGGEAWVQAGDLAIAATSKTIVAAIDKKYGRLDILVNNAGLNIPKRSWADLAADGIDTVLGVNLSGAFYCSIAVLPIMRRQKDGVLIHTSSWAGRFVSSLSGPVYTASKHAVVAMSHSINLEEFVHGIRSTVINPAEVATEILDKRPIPVPQEERARLLQPEDLAESIAHVALAPAHVCIDEILLSPTYKRMLVAQAKAAPAKKAAKRASSKVKAD